MVASMPTKGILLQVEKQILHTHKIRCAPKDEKRATNKKR
jgi:hypothetical protein